MQSRGGHIWLWLGLHHVRSQLCRGLLEKVRAGGVWAWSRRLSGWIELNDVQKYRLSCLVLSCFVWSYLAPIARPGRIYAGRSYPADARMEARERCPQLHPDISARIVYHLVHPTRHHQISYRTSLPPYSILHSTPLPHIIYVLVHPCPPYGI